MGLTNFQRKTWLDLLTEKAKRQKEEADRAKSRQNMKVPSKLR